MQNSGKIDRPVKSKDMVNEWIADCSMLLILFSFVSGFWRDRYGPFDLLSLLF